MLVPARTRLGINDDVIWRDQPLLQQRVQRQLHARWVASRICHEPRASNCISVNFRQPVHCLFLQLWRGVFASIPAPCAEIARRQQQGGCGTGVMGGEARHNEARRGEVR